MPQKFDLSTLPPAPDLSFETPLWEAGIWPVAGVDEAGRGALAGPVAAAAVILPADPALGVALAGVRDSKQMTPEGRAFWAARIKETASAWGVGLASAEEIDSLGILPATLLAARRSLDALPLPPQHLLLDYIQLPGVPFPQLSLVKGDARSLSIAAASVLAKTARDALLCELDARFPDYGFAAHKGYGTARHCAALVRLGPCEIHRLSFKLKDKD
jgi:ribonuclease HII